MADPSEIDEQFMRRAIRLAMNGRGRAEPNPMVGCVIVKNGKTIGEGYHQQYGQPHAEPNALANCTQSPEGATAYVTLEPCCHTNKQTPPCVPRLTEAKIARIVIGSPDPNPAVNGKGINQLRAAGIEVTAPILEAQCRQLIAPFIAGIKFDRPYVTLKWAQTSDRKIAGAGGARLQISNSASAALVHQLRSRSDAIMVGVNTVIIDDPLLTARGVSPARDLLRVVLDSRLRIPATSRLLDSGMRHVAPLMIYCGESANTHRAGAYSAELGVKRVNAAPDGGLDLSEILNDLNNANGEIDRPITQLLVEPGPTLAGSFFRDNLADRVWVFRSKLKIGNDSAPTAALIPEGYISTGEINLNGDTLTEYLNPRSPVFFAAEPSADLVLTTP